MRAAPQGAAPVPAQYHRRFPQNINQLTKLARNAAVAALIFAFIPPDANTYSCVPTGQNTSMNSRCRCFEYLVVRPTLRLLEVDSEAAVQLIIGTGLAETGFATPAPGKHGYFAMSAAQHRQVWDQYLAFRPDRASVTRSLASPVDFLKDPDAELDSNPAYATAIAWLLFESHAIELPAANAYHDLAQIWRGVYHNCETLPLANTDHYWQQAIQHAA